jgi:hypothetical protein
MTKTELVKYVVDKIAIETCFSEKLFELYVIDKTINGVDKTREDILKYSIEDLISYVGIDEDADIENYNNNKTEDLISGWADGNTSISYSDLYKHLPVLSEYAEEWLDENGYDKKRGLIGIIKGGEYNFYNQLGRNIKKQIGLYIKENLELSGDII